jgi:hypothetical protein
MADPYHIDLERFSLERFRHSLETGEVLPGRRILKEKIAEHFKILESMGIRNLEDLIQALKSSKKLEQFSKKSGLPQDYLVILRREANSHIPKPVNLRATWLCAIPRLSVPDLNDAVHRTIGTFPEGTVRRAASVFTTSDDIHATMAAIRKIAHA